MAFAEGTNVDDVRTRMEIERLLSRYGADEFGYITRVGEALIGFRIKNIRVEMRVPLPLAADPKFKRTPKRRQMRNDQQAWEAWQMEVRRRWRCLLMVIKAKLVAVEDGVTTFETEFMPYMVCGDGQTIGMKLLPLIQKSRESGGPLLLTAGGAA